MKKALLLVIFCVAFGPISYAQLKETDRSARLPERKHKYNETSFGGGFSENSGMYIGFGYHQSDMLNAQYGLARKNKEIRRRFGDALSFGYTYSAVSFDIQWFSSGFYTGKAVMGFQDSVKIRHRGLECSISYMFMPHAKVFVPYIGLGAQTAALGSGIGLGDNTTDPNKKDYVLKSSTNMSALIWKAGLRLNVSRGMFLLGEFKRSMGADEKSFTQLHIGMVYIARNKHYRTR